MSIREKFSSNKDIEHDQYQANIVDRLEELQKEILDERSIINKFLSLFRRKIQNPMESIYGVMLEEVKHT